MGIDFVEFMIARLFLLVGEAIGEVNLHGRSLQRIDNQAYAQYDEGDGEQLPHIERHTLLPLHLLVLDKLNQESGREEDGEEGAEYQARAALGIAAPIHPHQQAGERDIGRGLV